MAGSKFNAPCVAPAFYVDTLVERERERDRAIQVGTEQRKDTEKVTCATTQVTCAIPRATICGQRSCM
jgi:hypothetical protein